MDKKRVSRKGFSKGFTLVEMMIVIAVIAILATMAIPKLTAVLEEAKASETSGVFKMYADKMKFIKDKDGEYPADLPTVKLDGDAKFDYSLVASGIDTTNYKCFAIQAELKDDTDRVIYFIHQEDETTTTCLDAINSESGQTASDTVANIGKGENWKGNIYYGKYYE
jgi:prepilin-type N-terminal cleavage/methylation domain-containing protein